MRFESSSRVQDKAESAKQRSSNMSENKLEEKVFMLEDVGDLLDDHVVNLRSIDVGDKEIQ